MAFQFHLGVTQTEVQVMQLSCPARTVHTAEPFYEMKCSTDSPLQVVLRILQMGKIRSGIDILPEIFGWRVVIATGTTETINTLLHLSHTDICNTAVVVGTDRRKLPSINQTIGKGDNAFEVAYLTSLNHHAVGSAVHRLIWNDVLSALSYTSREYCQGDDCHDDNLGEKRSFHMHLVIFFCVRYCFTSAKIIHFFNFQPSSTRKLTIILYISIPDRGLWPYS